MATARTLVLIPLSVILPGVDTMTLKLITSRKAKLKYWSVQKLIVMD
ncbi:TPA: hypothetical protein MYO46_005625 [Citrobacter farmeri]|nr:hypothetical protein [Citrobacter farmeri]